MPTIKNIDQITYNGVIYKLIDNTSGYAKSGQAGVGTVTQVNTSGVLSGGPITGTGTLSLAAASPNQILAGPSSGSTAAAPTYRTLVAADIPTITKSKISDFPTIPSAGTATPSTIGTASAGSATTWSRSDHVHDHPTSGVTAKTTSALYPFTVNNTGHITAVGTAVTSLPASDVSAWAKASTKPTYTASEVGAATSGHTHATSIATSTGTNQLTLAYGQKYSLTAGGTSYVFTMPAASTGTVTAVKINGVTHNPTNGVVDLGTIEGGSGGGSGSFDIVYNADNAATDGAGIAEVSFLSSGSSAGVKIGPSTFTVNVGKSSDPATTTKYTLTSLDLTPGTWLLDAYARAQAGGGVGIRGVQFYNRDVNGQSSSILQYQLDGGTSLVNALSGVKTPIHLNLIYTTAENITVYVVGCQTSNTTNLQFEGAATAVKLL